jgi:hypothetical protein
VFSTIQFIQTQSVQRHYSTQCNIGLSRCKYFRSQVDYCRAQCTLWCLAFYVLCIPNIKLTFAVQLFHNKILLQISHSRHLFDERQFAFCCSSVFCSDDTAQEHLLPIILKASSSAIHNLISSVWHTGLYINVLSWLRKLSQQKPKYLEVFNIEPD